MVEMAVRYPEFAQRLTWAMAQAGLEIVDLTERMGVTYEMVRRYTMGVAMPREPRLKKLADLVGKSPSWLAFGVDEYAESGPMVLREDVALYQTLPLWPLKKSTAERIRALTPSQQKRADDAFDAVLKGLEAETAAKKDSK